ncbi:hypothetical protein DPEC_G00339920 [Dallia pectoralis]|uniref:Uncharacterized protein n=1 Tax=Dallia pectoralis TaxID=75939 RepID=A0ACC2F512_DALPE|nr:hypothetical protein DPEC_G00339920 [Dallia pectoralis]
MKGKEALKAQVTTGIRYDGYLNSPRFKAADKVQLSISHPPSESADMSIINLAERSEISCHVHRGELAILHEQHPNSTRGNASSVVPRCALRVSSRSDHSRPVRKFGCEMLFIMEQRRRVIRV